MKKIDVDMQIETKFNNEWIIANCSNYIELLYISRKLKREIVRL